MTVKNDDRNKQKRSLVLPPQVDQSTLVRTAIDYPHHEIHEGSAFESSDTWQSIASSGVVYLLFSMDDSVSDLAHLLFYVNASGLCLVQLYEGATASGADPLVAFTHPVWNKRRPSANTNNMKVATRSSDTGVSGGTLIFETLVGGAGSPAAGTSPGGFGRDGELILKSYVNQSLPTPQTCYALKMTSLVADNNISAALNWYEHTDKY